MKTIKNLLLMSINWLFTHSHFQMLLKCINGKLFQVKMLMINSSYLEKLQKFMKTEGATVSIEAMNVGILWQLTNMFYDGMMQLIMYL